MCCPSANSLRIDQIRRLQAASTLSRWNRKHGALQSDQLRPRSFWPTGASVKLVKLFQHSNASHSLKIASRCCWSIYRLFCAVASKAARSQNVSRVPRSLGCFHMLLNLLLGSTWSLLLLAFHVLFGLWLLSPNISENWHRNAKFLSWSNLQAKPRINVEY